MLQFSKDSNIDWEKLQVSVHNTGSSFSSDNPTWVGYHNKLKKQQYTIRPNEVVTD